MVFKLSSPVSKMHVISWHLQIGELPVAIKIREHVFREIITVWLPKRRTYQATSQLTVSIHVSREDLKSLRLLNSNGRSVNGGGVSVKAVNKEMKKQYPESLLEFRAFFFSIYPRFQLGFLQTDTNSVEE